MEDGTPTPSEDKAVKRVDFAEPNYRDLFLKTSGFVYDQIYMGCTDVEGALDILRGVLVAKNASSTLIKFER